MWQQPCLISSAASLFCISVIDRSGSASLPLSHSFYSLLLMQ